MLKFETELLKVLKCVQKYSYNVKKIGMVRAKDDLKKKEMSLSKKTC
jgi:hypothetical protein